MILAVLLHSKEYKEQKLFPVLQSLARRTGHSDMYEGMTHETEPLIMPPNVSRHAPQPLYHLRSTFS